MVKGDTVYLTLFEQLFSKEEGMEVGPREGGNQNVNLTGNQEFNMRTKKIKIDLAKMKVMFQNE